MVRGRDPVPYAAFPLQRAFFTSNEELLKKYGQLRGLEQSEMFLLDHPHIASDFTASWLTIEALNHAIDHEDAQMCVMAEQCIVVQYLLELSKTLNAVATNTNMIKNFFKKSALLLLIEISRGLLCNGFLRIQASAKGEG
jgi:hypothetical protein